MRHLRTLMEAMGSFVQVSASLEPPSTRTFAGIVGASKTSNDVLPGVREDPSQGRLELLAMPRRAGDSRRS
jgi:hypothetical protein